MSKRICGAVLVFLLGQGVAFAAEVAAPADVPESAPAAHPLERFKALAGEWSAEGLDGNSDPHARVRYEVTAAGNAVLETQFPGTPHEMRTLYFRDGDDVVLTHYCASGHHPTMRAKAPSGETLEFAFDRAANFDPARDGHMHDARFEFAGADEIRTRWTFWEDGKPGQHVADLHLKRVD